MRNSGENGWFANTVRRALQLQVERITLTLIPLATFLLTGGINFASILDADWEQGQKDAREISACRATARRRAEALGLRRR